MRYLEDLKKIDWRALGDEELELSELVGKYIESKDGRALDLIFWEHILPDSEYLTQATSYVVEFLIPLLEDEERGDEAAIIWNLTRDLPGRKGAQNFYYGPDRDAAEWSFLTLQAVAEGSMRLSESSEAAPTFAFRSLSFLHVFQNVQATTYLAS